MLKEHATSPSLQYDQDLWLCTDIRAFTDAILTWWRTNHPIIPTWARAARIVFSLQCSSAASERVFSLVQDMFGTDQLATLADQLQGAAMLKYNKRTVG